VTLLSRCVFLAAEMASSWPRAWAFRGSRLLQRWTQPAATSLRQLICCLAQLSAEQHELWLKCGKCTAVLSYQSLQTLRQIFND